MKAKAEGTREGVKGKAEGTRLVGGPLWILGREENGRAYFAAGAMNGGIIHQIYAGTRSANSARVSDTANGIAASHNGTKGPWPSWRASAESFLYRIGPWPCWTNREHSA